MSVMSLKNLLMLVLVLLINSELASAQSGARNVVIETNRQELDTILMRKPIPATEDASARRAMLQQVNEDFKALQTLNNKVMNAVTDKGELDYKSIAGWIGEIKSKASRLKSNLALPQASKEPRETSAEEQDLKQQLLTFDKLVESFVTNPLFQTTKVVEVGLATKASNDLTRIIEESGRLKKAAARMAK